MSLEKSRDSRLGIYLFSFDQDWSTRDFDELFQAQGGPRESGRK